MGSLWRRIQSSLREEKLMGNALFWLGLSFVAWKLWWSKPSPAVAMANAAALRTNAAALYQQAQMLEPIQPGAAQTLRAQADGMVAAAEKLEAGAR